ncbi:MAG: alpha/beta fold hydrolase [Elusimicrobiota bacterium]|jgi:pimeloyl-ACP methyl ester carboxylesterase
MKFFPCVYVGMLLVSLVSPLLPAATPESKNPNRFWQHVSWKTPEGVSLVGFYHPAGGAGRLTWVLLHGLGSVKEEWSDFAQQAARTLDDGFLIYDLRGHGASTQGKPGEKLDYREWRQAGPGSPWSLMGDDLKSAVAMLMDRYHLTENRIALGGASLGANVSLVYAGRHQAVPAVILLSPGLAYAGVVTPGAYRGYGQRPLFLAASPEDADAFDTVRQFVAQRGDSNLRVASGDGAAHGVAMAKNPVFTKKLIDWMKEMDERRQ